MSKLIRNWEELSALGESSTHVVNIDPERGCGWLDAKDRRSYDSKKGSYLSQISHLDVYLSTHTFYGSQYEQSTNLLRACGFDVEIANWDEPDRKKVSDGHEEDRS